MIYLIFTMLTSIIFNLIYISINSFDEYKKWKPFFSVWVLTHPKELGNTTQQKLLPD